MLDLTQARTRARCGVDPATLTVDAPADLAACRALARGAMIDGDYGAILAPSAALAGGVNLIVYVEHTGHLRELTNGRGRVTITPGYVWAGTAPHS